jgi:hypothetical protein
MGLFDLRLCDGAHTRDGKHVILTERSDRRMTLGNELVAFRG